MLKMRVKVEKVTSVRVSLSGGTMTPTQNQICLLRWEFEIVSEMEKRARNIKQQIYWLVS